MGEIGDSHRGIELMEEYTAGRDKLHMAYTFDMLGKKFTAEHFRSKISTFFSSSNFTVALRSSSGYAVMTVPVASSNRTRTSRKSICG